MVEQFAAGWRHFWSTFSRPLAFVLGFAAASVVSNLVYEMVKAGAKAVFR